MHEAELLEHNDEERLHLPPTPEEVDREDLVKVKPKGWMGWLGRGDP